METELQTILWPMLVLGVAIGIFGWMLYWAGVQVIGALVGASAGFSLAMMIDAKFDFGSLLTLVVILGLIAGGAAGVFLMRTIHFYAFFVVGLALGIPAGPAVMSIFSDQAWAQEDGAIILSSVISGLVGGLVLLAARRYVLAVMAAALAGGLVAMSLPYSIESKLIVGTAGFFLSSAIQVGLIRMFLPTDSLNLMDVKKAPPPKPAAPKKKKGKAKT